MISWLPRRMRISSSLLAVALGALLVSPGTLFVEGAEDAKPTPKSPYPAGPPPVTDGYTDTSHGGTKTSGEAPIPPPEKDGKVKTLQGVPEPEPPAPAK
ncbi:MAG: hypothetical protein ACREQJ_15485 [Candidatus Binatia bacterium]